MAMEPGDYRAEINSSSNPTASLMREALKEYVDTSPGESHRAQFQKEVDQHMKTEEKLLKQKGMSEGEIELSLKERRGQVEARIIRDREGYSVMTSSVEPTIQKPRSDSEQKNFLQSKFETAKAEYHSQLNELSANQNEYRNTRAGIAKDNMEAAERELRNLGPRNLSELEVDTRRKQVEIDAQLAALKNPQITTNVQRGTTSANDATTRLQERLRQTGAHIPAPHKERQSEPPIVTVETLPVETENFDQFIQDIERREAELRREKEHTQDKPKPEVVMLRGVDTEKNGEQVSFHDLLDQTRELANAYSKARNNESPDYAEVRQMTLRLSKLIEENKIAFPKLPFDIPWSELSDAYVWDLSFGDEVSSNGLGGILSGLSRLSESKGNSPENIEHYIKELEHHLKSTKFYGDIEQIVDQVRSNFPQIKGYFESNFNAPAEVDLDEENRKLEQLVRNFEPEIVIVFDKSQHDLSSALESLKENTEKYKSSQQYRKQVRNEIPQKVYYDAISLVSNQLNNVERHLQEDINMDPVRRLMLTNYVQKEKALVALYRSVADTSLLDKELFDKDWKKLDSEIVQIKQELGGYGQETIPQAAENEVIVDPNREYHPIDIYRMLDADSRDLAFLVVSHYFKSPVDTNELQEKIQKAQETINRLYSDKKEDRFNVRVSKDEISQMQLVKQYAELERALVAHAQKTLNPVSDSNITEQNRREFNETLAEMYKVKDTINPRRK